MKPRIYMARGRWYCNGVAGNDPRSAFANWQRAEEVWRYVPGGYVPR